MSTPPTPADPADHGLGVRVLPLRGIGEIRAGDSLAAHLLPALREAGVRRGDVLCVSTKIVSKALGLTVDPAARDAAIAASAVRTVARRRHGRTVTAVVQIPSGPVMAAAGVDASNAPEGPLLLPEDPDACAAALRTELLAGLGEAWGATGLGVVLSDTSSRVWRVGVSDLALGAAGIATLQDLRGAGDDAGRTLTVTVRALADEIAAAADLVKGKAERVPAALVRGVPGALAEPGTPARALSRGGADDWFRRPSLESVWQALGLDPAEEPVAAMSPEEPEVRIARAVQVATRPRAGTGPTAGPAAGLRREGPGTLVVHPAEDSPAGWAAAGALHERLLTALGAEEIAASLPPLAVRLEDPRPGASGSPARSPRAPGPGPVPDTDTDTDTDTEETP